MSNSVTIAKDRLKTLLVSDRINCTPDTLKLLENELYKTISKYISIDKDKFQVYITRDCINITLTGENT